MVQLRRNFEPLKHSEQQNGQWMGNRIWLDKGQVQKMAKSTRSLKGRQERKRNYLISNVSYLRDCSDLRCKEHKDLLDEIKFNTKLKYKHTSANMKRDFIFHLFHINNFGYTFFKLTLCLSSYAIKSGVIF